MTNSRLSQSMRGNQNAKKSGPQVSGGFSAEYVASKKEAARIAAEKTKESEAPLARKFLMQQNPVKSLIALGVGTAIKAGGEATALFTGKQNAVSKMPISVTSTIVSELAMGTDSSSIKAGRDFKAIKDAQDAADKAYVRALTKY